MVRPVHENVRDSNTKRQRLLAALAQARERGLVLPDEVLQDVHGVIPEAKFRKSANGYYLGLDGRIFNANPIQKSFIDSLARYVLLSAGRGAGKSASAAQKAVKKIEDGNSGIIANPDFENLKISTWPEFCQWLDWDMVVKRHRHMSDPAWTPTRPFKLSFKHGPFVIVKGIKDPNSARGPNVNWFWYDEPARGDPAGQDWIIANASVRIPPNPQSWATGTPGGKDHWMYKFFIEQEIPEEAIEAYKELNLEAPLIDVFFTSIEDNRENLDPSYYAAMLASYPIGWLRQQELYGEFVDQGGVLGDRSWFDGQVITELPDIKKTVRFWDLAATEKKVVSGKKLNDPDETVGTRMSQFAEQRDWFCIEDQVAGRWEWKDIKTQILATALRDGPYVEVWIEEEPGSGGKNQVAELAEFIKKNAPGTTVKGQKPEGDKVVRANPWFAEAAQKKIFLLAGSWVKPFLDQLSSFPIARHDDKIDSVSGARQVIAPIRSWKNIRFLNL